MFRKRIITMLLCTVLALSVFLTACSNNEADGSADGNDNEDQVDQVDIQVWLTPQWKGVFDPSEEGADDDSFFKYAAEKFIEQYEDYDVDIDVQIVAGDERDALLNTALSGGTPPDIFFESTFAMGDYAHRGALVPLNDIVDDEAKNDIADNYWDSVTFGGDIYFYPFSHMPGTLVYNADMFKAAGLEDAIGEQDEIKTWTLEEFENILETLKTDLPEDEFPNAHPMGLFAVNNQGDTWNLAYLRMFGNEFFDENGNIILDDENGVKAAEWMKKIYDNGWTNPGAESVSSNDVNAMFHNQQLAVSFTNSVLFNNLLADMEKGEVSEFDVRLANIPSESGDPLTFTYVTGASVFNTGDETRIQVAKDFVKFFSSDPELVKASKNGIPVRTSVADEFKDDNPLFAAYDANAQYMFNFTGNVPGYNELREVLYPELQALYTGNKTAEEAISDYQTKGNEVIERSKEDSVIYNQ